jgi:hypothetical protein
MTGAAEAFVTHAVARALLDRTARVLGAGDIPVLPLKGVWLQMRVYDPPQERPITDVDVLVPESRYDEALERLVADGFARKQANLSETALWHDDLPIPLDLHRRLFQPGAFALPTHAIFSRAQPPERRGAAAWEPDPLDVLAHLVGHFAKSRAAPGGCMYHRDFERLFDVLNLDPGRAAAHLDAAGMGRAARYALAHNVRSGHAALAQVVAALTPDPVGELLCRACSELATRGRPGGMVGALPGLLLEPSLGAGLVAGLRRTADKLVHCR